MPNPAFPPDLFSQFLYRDAPGGIAFLERAFGFEPVAVYPGDGGRVMHAELRAGRGYVMTASWDDATYKFLVPKDVGNVSTGSLYIGTPEVDSLFARAKSAGAEVVQGLTDTDYGSRGFSVRDPEGFLWHVGTYRPTVDGGDPYSSPETGVYSGMRYRDARSAIAWLTKAFGFEEQEVYAGEGDEIAHAQLRFGNDIFMTGSARDDVYNFKTPQQLDGAYTHIICGYAADADAHCARARAAGAEIMEEPADKPYGARIYVARDPEGYVWSFGTYRPAMQPASDALAAAQ
jgi:uncharacterized glyoxalase superfamily protein PhnB